MFDTIFVKTELPLTDELKQLDVRWNEIDYQTKSLESCMSTYEITKDGELSVIQGAWWEEEKVVEVIKVPCHGKISFYNYIEDKNDYDWFVDFTAYFTYGKLDKIELDNVDKTSVKQRIADQLIWELERKAKEKKLSSRIKRVLRKVPGYSWVVRKLGRAMYNLGNKIYSISMHWS